MEIGRQEKSHQHRDIETWRDREREMQTDQDLERKKIWKDRRERENMMK